MKIRELIKDLQNLKEKYGDIDVVDANAEDLNFAEIQKLIQWRSEFNEHMINQGTQDLDENYLDYLRDSDRFVAESLCVRLY